MTMLRHGICKPMEPTGFLVQFLVSLLAIAALAALTYWLKLGSAPTLASHDDARRFADQAVSGFDAVDCAIDQDGHGAIMSDAHGRLLVLRPHGSRYVGRIVEGSAVVHADEERLLIDLGEKRFGPISLTVGDPQIWVDAHQRLKSQNHA